MSMTTLTSAMCPGARALLPGLEPEYMRVVVEATWIDGAKNSQVLYLHQHTISLTKTGIEQLQNDILTRLRSLDTPPRAASVTYHSYGPIELSDAEVAEAGWRMMSGPSA